jgi:hypothetical protein
MCLLRSRKAVAPKKDKEYQAEYMGIFDPRLIISIKEKVYALVLALYPYPHRIQKVKRKEVHYVRRIKKETSRFDVKAAFGYRVEPDKSFKGYK